MNAVLLAHLASTLFMVGLIWFIQIVHYPLYGHVGEESFVRYQAFHVSRVTFVVLPPMVVELGSAAYLLLARNSVVPRSAAALGLAMVLAIWGSTFLLQVPRHSILEKGFDAEAIRTLVQTNWLRTVLWTVRGGLALYWTRYLTNATGSASLG